MPIDPHDLRGMYVVDRDGSPVGTVEELYVDRPTGEVRYLGISAEALGVHVLVPLDGVVDGRRRARQGRPGALHAHAPDGGAAAVARRRAHRGAGERDPQPLRAHALLGRGAGAPDHPRADARRSPRPTRRRAAAGAPDSEVYDARRTDVAARQTEPAPTTRIADAEVEAAIERGHDPAEVRLKRWGT